MIPVSLDPSRLALGLLGHGPLALRRWHLLAEGGATRALCFAVPPDADLAAAVGESYRPHLPTDADLAALDVLWIVGLPDAQAVEVATLARRHKILVNVEDRREHCSFHNSAELRRGALLLTVSTDGKSPGLAQRIRNRLGRDYGPEWAERLETISRQREVWRAEGHPLPALAAMTGALLKQNGWLDEPDTTEE